MKVFERLVLRYLKTATDSVLDPRHFVYRANRSVEDSVCLRLHLILKHLDRPNTYARILFIDNSLVFNTIIQHKHSIKLRLLNVNSQTYRWILDFLLNWTQVVKFNSKLSKYRCASRGGGGYFLPYRSGSSPMTADPVKFSDDTTIEGLVTNADESAYRQEVDRWLTGAPIMT